MNPRILLAKLCYYLGDRVSYPMLRHDSVVLFHVYLHLMRWSDKLDNQNAVWGPPINQ
jgi:hypothetical protein